MRKVSLFRAAEHLGSVWIDGSDLINDSDKKDVFGRQKNVEDRSDWGCVRSDPKGTATLSHGHSMYPQAQRPEAK